MAEILLSALLAAVLAAGAVLLAVTQVGRHVKNTPQGMGYVSLLDYGADPSGVRDSTDSLRRACEENSLVYLPEGTYRIGPVTIGSVTLQGAGDGKTVLKTANLTDNLLTFSQDGWHVKDLKFTADSFRTGGAYICSGARYASIENVALSKHYIGFELDGCIGVDITHVTALDGTPHAVSQGGAAVRLGNTRYTGQVNIRGLFAWPHTLETPPSSAICMKHVDVASVSDTLLIGHMKDVLLQPGKGQFTALVQMTNSCFDTAQSGMCVEPVDGGRVLRCGFSNIWFGAHTGDGMVVNGTDGAVPGLQFTNCMFMGNGENGVRASGVGVDGLYFSNCFASANARTGLFLGRGSQRVVWYGGVLGASHEAGPNLEYGYRAEEACSGKILLVDLERNGLGAGRDEKGAVELLAAGAADAAHWL